MENTFFTEREWQEGQENLSLFPSSISFMEAVTMKREEQSAQE